MYVSQMLTICSQHTHTHAHLVLHFTVWVTYRLCS
uniref:Uncharacterized protein n=1 Tax=Anguilla anguilla TaxID=7936 RepID=A0A0E9V0G0_ANGAN